MPNNKIKILLSLVFIFAMKNIFAQELVVKGVYQGENLFVKNPFKNVGVGFCVNEVRINGQMSTDEIQSNAFEIDLSYYKLKIGDKITITIKHDKECEPKILNIGVIKPKSTFKIKSIKFDKESQVLSWITTNELVPIPYIVEQFKWQKWVKVATVKGKGGNSTNRYSAKVNLHSGKNRFRVKQVDFSKQPRYSTGVTYRSLSPVVTFSPSKPRTEIKFSQVTNYEIYNFYGELVTKGRAKSVNVSKLKKGNYFLNFDNTMERFYKR